MNLIQPNTKKFIQSLNEMDDQAARDSVKGNSELAYNLGYKEGLYMALRLLNENSNDKGDND